MAYDEDLREIDGQAFRNADDTSQITPEPNPGKFPWRKNVLTLLLIAYSSIILIFIVLVFSGMEPPDAYDKINVPFMALVGGTLTITKDLLR